MLLFALIGWWYGEGFLVRLRGIFKGFQLTADRFSIGLLARTLFDPFRQIDAGARGRGLSEMFSAFLSRLVSRLVGFMMRTVMILAGGLVLLVQGVGSLLMILLHLAVPLLPVVGVIMVVVGWVPVVELMLVW